MRAADAFEVEAYGVTHDGEYTICSLLVNPNGNVRTNLYGEYGLDVWLKGDEYLGDIYAFADFQYNGSSAIILDHNYQDGNLADGATYHVSKESYANSGVLNKAYYKITYTFTYANSSKNRTLEVNCSKSGVVGNNNAIIKL